MGASKTKILLICGAVVIFVLLFISPKIESKDQFQSGMDVSEASLTIQTADNTGFEVYAKAAIGQLNGEQKKLFDRIKKLNVLDSTTFFWDRVKRPDIASYYTEEKAERSNTSNDWNAAGKRYYSASQFTEDQTEIPVLYQRAIYCFGKAIALDPGNSKSKILLASCYIEGTADPMRGINMLKAVEKADSNILELQLAFAFFSVKSGQLDKAITRFNKALRIDSNYIEVYLHLADIYEKQNEKEETVRMLQNYSSRTNDPTTKVEIDKYIQQLKQNN